MSLPGRPVGLPYVYAESELAKVESLLSASRKGDV